VQLDDTHGARRCGEHHIDDGCAHHDNDDRATGPFAVGRSRRTDALCSAVDGDRRDLGGGRSRR
jgi:hypothetical protein